MGRESREAPAWRGGFVCFEDKPLRDHLARFMAFLAAATMWRFESP